MDQGKYIKFCGQFQLIGGRSRERPKDKGNTNCGRRVVEVRKDSQSMADIEGNDPIKIVQPVFF